MANERRERVLREILRWLQDRGGEIPLRSMQAWIGTMQHVSWRTADTYLGDLYVRGLARRVFGMVEITDRGRRTFIDVIPEER